MLAQVKYITYDEFINLDKNTDDLLEYIDGVVYNQASPSRMHQTVAINIATEFNLFLMKRNLNQLLSKN